MRGFLDSGPAFGLTRSPLYGQASVTGRRTLRVSASVVIVAEAVCGKYDGERNLMYKENRVLSLIGDGGLHCQD
jgi:hypothetical protein